MNEDLGNWFSKSHPEGNWKRYNTKGEAIGPCAREQGEAKPKCLSNEKAAKMSKDEIAAAVKRKRREDPVADRKGKGGKPKMVSNKIEEQSSEEKYCPMCRKRERRMDCSYGPAMWDAVTIGGVSVSEASFEITHTASDVNKAKRAKKIDTLAQRGSGGEQQTAAKMVGVSLPPIRKEEISIVDKILLEMEAEVLAEKNVPTNPKLWAKWKAKAKAKFDVYPSAYANGWAAKGYKSEGGGWKSVSEETIEDLNGNSFVEVVDLIKPEPIKKVEESVRIPAKTGNIISVTLTWRGKYYMMKLFFPQTTKPNRQEVQDQISKVYPGSKVQSFYISDIKPGEQFLQTEDWQSVNRKDKTDGLSQKAVNAYRKENPGSKLQTAVTEKKPKGKRAKRRASFCRRMKGMKSKLTSAKTARDPDSRINKALRRWNCN